MTIRKATLADLPHLVNFNQAMALETENKRLDEVTLTAGVRAVLENPQYGFYLVAEQQGEIVAGLMVTYEWSDWRNGIFWWIQSVYVLPVARRSGLYSALQGKVEALAAEAGNVCGIRLYVEKDNHVAQQTYIKNGLHESHYLMFESSHD
ncbi:GNAT family N-acetyltransferase [Bowmanella sp. JS7-9]|uniref:GNAT family N-acetyltransferase n=1 Tax=Pseudobowmanella zhangzhouensis TaxID=1537679 RepID=A0ABW1XK64_9ALTE|nr:GNAT family N-acetyltransferase [Bowmanella sp. JS7-9]TBX22506.1 GCN5 family acetyltransferase [Bowmanella sp. JS7-9]